MRQLSAGRADALFGSTSRPSTRIVGEPGNRSSSAAARVRTSRTLTSTSRPRAASTSSRSCLASGCDGQPSQKRNSMSTLAPYLRAGSPRGQAPERSRDERLSDRGSAIPARDEDLAPVAFDRVDDALGDVLRPDDDPPVAPAQQPVLREALRVHEPGV